MTETLRKGKANPRGIFANNELDLSHVDVWGFDYDYTLAVYTSALNGLMYSLAAKRLVEQYKYPEEILEKPYDPKFAVRGLHYDINSGLLLKLDAFSRIQGGTVYRGKMPLGPAEYEHLYLGDSVPLEYLEPGPDGIRVMRQLTDLFSLPEAGLLVNLVDFLEERPSVDYDPWAVFSDVENAMKSVHLSGDMYKAVTGDLNRYLHGNPGLKYFLERLVEEKKTVFLITNSPYSFMPFREYITEKNSLTWQKISKLEKGKVYAEEPMLKFGWYTGAIVPELEKEITTQNSNLFQFSVQWLEILTGLIEVHQDEAKAKETTREVLSIWLKERDRVRSVIKSLFNPQFGSIFRTFHNPSFFMRRLSRLADVYTSRLPNFLQFGLDHSFYPRRSPLAHETFYGSYIESQEAKGPSEIEIKK